MKFLFLFLLTTISVNAIEFSESFQVEEYLDNLEGLYFEGIKGNGGDPCERRFLEVGEDILSWIKQGGADGLKLEISKEEYSSKMISSILESKVACVDERIILNNVPKVCINVKTREDKKVIICDRDKFLKSSEEDQYQLIHHEFAGLAQIEKTSDYSISDQLSSFLEFKVVKKLVVKSEIQNFDNIEEIHLAKETQTFLVDAECGVYENGLLNEMYRGVSDRPLLSFYNVENIQLIKCNDQNYLKIKIKNEHNIPDPFILKEESVVLVDFSKNLKANRVLILKGTEIYSFSNGYTYKIESVNENVVLKNSRKIITVKGEKYLLFEGDEPHYKRLVKLASIKILQ